MEIHFVNGFKKFAVKFRLVAVCSSADILFCLFPKVFQISLDRFDVNECKHVMGLQFA